MPITEQKLIWKPADNGQNGSAIVITADARLKAESQSLSTKTHMLIIEALATDEFQPVKQPIRIQKNTCTANAFFRLILRASRINGTHARKPAK